MNYPLPLIAMSVIALVLIFIFRKKIFITPEIYDMAIHKTVSVASVENVISAEYANPTFKICDCGQPFLHGNIYDEQGVIGPILNKHQGHYWAHQRFTKGILTEKKTLDLIVLIDKSGLGEDSITFIQ